MSRLWYSALVVGCAAGVALGAALIGASFWPAVALFGLFGVLSGGAALVDAGVEVAKREVTLGANGRYAALQKQVDTIDARMAQINLDELVRLQKNVEHLLAKDALMAGM